MTTPSTPSAAPARLVSLDALRGLDMLIIAGLDTLVYRWAQAVPDNSVVQGLREQMTHVDWEGLVAYDLVFPLFVFLSGVSMRLSHERCSLGKGEALQHEHLIEVTEDKMVCHVGQGQWISFLRGAFIAGS